MKPWIETAVDSARTIDRKTADCWYYRKNKLFKLRIDQSCLSAHLFCRRGHGTQGLAICDNYMPARKKCSLQTMRIEINFQSIVPIFLFLICCLIDLLSGQRCWKSQIKHERMETHFYTCTFLILNCFKEFKLIDFELLLDKFRAKISTKK